MHTVRLLPSRPGQRHLVHAHLEAHDNLAIATDLPDGSIEISGPATCREEIAAVASEIARSLGMLVVRG